MSTNKRVAIIGAGASGITAAVFLRRAGYEIEIFEKASAPGGVWHYNTYPGVACDIETALYSFSFEENLRWSRPYAQGPEIQRYMAGAIERLALRDVLRLNTEVVSLAWDDARATWTVTLGDGATREVEFVVSAVGLFGAPLVPEIPGLDTFAGTTIHSARWDHEHTLDGEAVAVVGSAASAVQLIPEIAKVVGSLCIFQRTANWVLPKSDQPYTDAQLASFEADPSIRSAHRQQLFDLIDKGLDFTANEAIRNGAEQAGRQALLQVADPDTRRRLTPDHPWGCKRPLMSNDFYPVFNQPNVELVTDPIARIVPEGIVTADGTVRRVDTIVLSTGFHVGGYLAQMKVTGRDGVTIADAWADGPSAYLGLLTAGFPNLFMLYGPNTNGGNSIIAMIEAQVAFMMELLGQLDASGRRWLDVRRERLATYNAELQRGLDSVDVWNPGCNGYYRGVSGQIVTQWPWSITEYTRRTDASDLADFELGA
jgi:cation diffusion facilitator CzcD-associated flavoprotein CzcO